MRVVSWNVPFRGRVAAQRQGDLLRTLSPDLILLQEANPGSADVLREAAGADWLIRAVELRSRDPDDRPVRSRGVAIAGRGQPPARAWLPAAVALPDRILAAQMKFGGLPLTAVSYHAPPGVSWGLIKPRRVRVLARHRHRPGDPESRRQHPGDRRGGLRARPHALAYRRPPPARRARR